MDKIANYSESVFEDIKHVNEYSQEFWCARELQIALEYKQWRRFQNVIEKAKESCINSGNSVEDHFADVGKMVFNAVLALQTGGFRALNGFFKAPPLAIFKSLLQLPRIPELLTVFVGVLDVLESGLAVFFDVCHGVNSLCADSAPAGALGENVSRVDTRIIWYWGRRLGRRLNY